jgi:hypothetical protein
MGYFNRRYYKPAPTNNQFNGYNNRVNDPTLKDRLEKLLANPTLCQYPKTVEFMRSLLEQFNARGSLSHNQVKCIEDNEKRYSADNIAANSAAIEAWRSSYDANKRATMRLVAKWYKDMADAGSQPYYYRETCEKVLSDDNFVPSQATFEKIVNNKFAQRYVENVNSGAKYNAGDVVELTATAKNSRFAAHATSIVSGAIVIEVTDKVTSTKGSRQYKVLPIGSDQVLNVEERFLKYSK